MADEKKEMTPEQKAYQMLQSAMGEIAVQTGLMTEYIVVPQVKFREPSDEEKKKIEEAKEARVKKAEEQAKEDK